MKLERLRIRNGFDDRGGFVKTRPAWAEIDLGAIAHNLREIRRITQPQARIMAVVKANAYGHGAVPVSQVALQNGVSYLGVAMLDEALELRRAGIDAPILILGYTPKEQAEEAVRHNVTQTIYTLEMARFVSEVGEKLRQRAKVHIKIDTGMTRLGFLPGAETVEKIKEIAALPGLSVEGIFTHFAVSDIRDKAFTRQQFKLFTDMCAVLEREGVKIPIKHAANTGAIIDMPETHLDMVRLGISLYGLYPSPEVDRAKVSLKPALSLKAGISHLKEVPRGVTVSYGRTYTTQEKTMIATIPIGYADGYSRLLSSKAHVLIRGTRAPVAGVICMDQFMVDVGHIPDVAATDEVVLIGRQGDDCISADELAQLLGTINYEIVCMLSERIPRVYI